MKVWTVLPAYNEEADLPPLLDSLIEVFQDERKDFAILVVDDGSKDRTPEILANYAKTHPVVVLTNPKNMGLAETIRNGLLEVVKRASPKDIIVTMDADNTHPAGLALQMVRKIREGCDVVVASRYRPESQVFGLSLTRIVLSRVASIICRVLFPIRGIRDYTCGYRAYRASTLQELIRKHPEDFITETGFTCILNILLNLREFDLVFAEVPLILRYDLKQGQSKMRIVKMIRDSVSLLMRKRFGIEQQKAHSPKTS
jgi:dolichol-phosphate mannosyltransferase